MERELRILFIEDSTEDVELEERELRGHGFRVTSLRVDDESILLPALDAFRPDVIISDFSLPRMDGLSALKIVREHNQEVPFIFVSGTIGEDRAVNSLKAGATDYVVKDRIGKLYHAVTRALREVQERTDNKRLEGEFRQAQKMEAVGMLAGGIAHDFNNLLTSIIGYAYVIRESLPGDHSILKDLKEIEKSANRASELTKKLLAFSRKQVLIPRVLDLNAIVDDMSKMLRRVIGEHIEFTQKLQTDLGHVKADPSQIEQVILNLVVNARDAMPKGGKLIVETHDVVLDREYCSVGTGLTPGSHVMLAVSDTGIGMDPETQAKIFQPFFTTKEPGKGSGLGLSTVFGIVKQSKGHISVYSVQDKGSTFKVYFPRVDEAAPQYKSWVHMTIPKGGSEPVLVVEDEEPVRNLIAGLLKSAGYEVSAARNAVEAIPMLADRQIPLRLMVTDVVMPGMSGGQLAENARISRPGLKILYMSGYTEDAIIKQGELKEGTQFLPKPFTPEALLRAVRDALDATS